MLILSFDTALVGRGDHDYLSSRKFLQARHRYLGTEYLLVGSIYHVIFPLLTQAGAPLANA